mmetsp:Transcript_12503/g.17956  ORF Transcript_12503/g.17956 Transcript_12503/m.17956 type:complete len:244 (-) Transcript_12503:320-1051(-)
MFHQMLRPIPPVPKIIGIRQKHGPTYKSNHQHPNKDLGKENRSSMPILDSGIIHFGRGTFRSTANALIVVTSDISAVDTLVRIFVNVVTATIGTVLAGGLNRRKHIITKRRRRIRSLHRTILIIKRPNHQPPLLRTLRPKIIIYTILRPSIRTLQIIRLISSPIPPKVIQRTPQEILHLGSILHTIITAALPIPIIGTQTKCRVLIVLRAVGSVDVVGVSFDGIVVTSDFCAEAGGVLDGVAG